MYDNIIAMKLDIEGFETNVLLDLGEKDFLKRVKPCYIEYTIALSWSPGRQANDIFELLEELGVYDIATLF